MKKLLKKITAVIMTATIAISSMIVTTTASAAGVFDGAIKMEKLEYYTRQLKTDEITYFKITVPKDGTLTLRCAKAVGAGWTKFNLLDSNANHAVDLSYGDTLMGGNWERNLKVKEGTYYVKIISGKDQTLEDFYYTFTPDLKPTISLKLTMKKGTSIQLGSIVENYDGKVTWTSTKKSVATVSSTGKVTAKKKGTTTIRAQLDDGTYVQIKIVVKK